MFSSAKLKPEYIVIVRLDSGGEWRSRSVHEEVSLRTDLMTALDAPS